NRCARPPISRISKASSRQRRTVLPRPPARRPRQPRRPSLRRLRRRRRTDPAAGGEAPAPPSASAVEIIDRRVDPLFDQALAATRGAPSQRVLCCGAVVPGALRPAGPVVIAGAAAVG